MQEYGFSLTGIFPYKNRIYDSDLIRENMGQWKPLFSYILCSVISSNCLLWVPPIFTRYVVPLKMDAYWWSPFRKCENRSLIDMPIVYANSSKTFMWKTCSSLDNIPSVETLLQCTPQFLVEASVWSTRCSSWSCKLLPSNILRLFIHQRGSVLAKLSKPACVR